jgi:Flp pilus assembly protein TadG
MKRMRDESGQAAIVAVLCLTCILGFVGLATDVGVLLHAKRNLQIAADAAALAGANEIRVKGAGVADIKAAGKAASAQNGFTDGDANGTTVNIYPPPVDGPNLGKAGYVEAVVRRPQPTFFIQLVSSFTSMPVSARAVAFDGSTTNTDCFNVTNGSLPDAMKLDGNFTLDAPGCQVIDNSNSLQALDFTGAAGTLTAGSVGVVGGVTGHAGDSNPAPVPVPQSSDPLASQVAPLTAAQRAAAPCTAAPSGNNWAPATAGGIVCYSGNISINSPVTLAAGTYVFTGSLGLQGHGSLTGPTVAQPDSSGGTAGVTIYLAAPGGNMDMSGAGNSSISLAGGSVAYPNIVIYEEPLDTNKVNMEGTPITTLAGIIYLPSALLELGGNGNFSQAIQADIIVNTFYEFGSATVTLTKFPSTGPGFQLDTVALVE